MGNSFKMAWHMQERRVSVLLTVQIDDRKGTWGWPKRQQSMHTENMSLPITYVRHGNWAKWRKRVYVVMKVFWLLELSLTLWTLKKAKAILLWKTILN